MVIDMPRTFVSFVLLCALSNLNAAENEVALEIIKDKCQHCHGLNGEGTVDLPRLAGQHKHYISSQLNDFHERKRTNDNAIMYSIASKMTELEIEAVAIYVSGLK